MEEPRKKALNSLKEILRTAVVVARVLHGCRHLITDVEYSRVIDRSKADNASALDELVAVLLTKGNGEFDGFCSALRESGYAHWATQLEKVAKCIATATPPRERSGTPTNGECSLSTCSYTRLHAYFDNSIPIDALFTVWWFVSNISLYNHAIASS